MKYEKPLLDLYWFKIWWHFCTPKSVIFWMVPNGYSIWTSILNNLRKKAFCCLGVCSY